MTTKRFDCLLFLGGRGTQSWAQGTLVIDTASSRPDTLKVTIHGSRGEGELLDRFESYDEQRIDAAGFGAPRGHEIIEFKIDRSGSVKCVATTVWGELLLAVRALRRAKPKTPISKTANDEILVCVSCGMRIMSRGSEREGWKGIQMVPNDPALNYYCNKPVCADALVRAIEVAKVNWGYTDEPAAPAPAPVAAAPEEKSEHGKYGPPPEKPFL